MKQERIGKVETGESCKTSVYRLYDAVGNLLYIGCSKNVKRRTTDHKSKHWGAHIDRVLEVEYPTRSEALNEEIKAIMVEAPYFNSARTYGKDAKVAYDPSCLGIGNRGLHTPGYTAPPPISTARKVKRRVK